MKTARQKKARKNLGFFINNFKFRPPFQVLIDGTFAFAALEVCLSYFNDRMYKGVICGIDIFLLE